MFPNRSTNSITLMQVITTKFKNKDRKKTQEAWQPNKPGWNHNFRPRTGVFGAYNWNTPQSIPNAHLNQDWCETNGNFFEKMAEFFSCLGDQTDPKIRPLRPIFYTPLKVAPVSMKTKIDVEPVETFEKMTKDQNLSYFDAHNYPKMGPLRPISTHL